MVTIQKTDKAPIYKQRSCAPNALHTGHGSQHVNFIARPYTQNTKTINTTPKVNTDSSNSDFSLHKQEKLGS